jgi:hypothetical protein
VLIEPYALWLIWIMEFAFLFYVGEEGVKELQRKRHSATPGVSSKGRVRKAARWKPESDDDFDEGFGSKFSEV